MSNQTTVKVEWRADAHGINAIKAGAEELGLAFEQNGQGRVWGQTRQAAGVIRCKGRFDVLLDKRTVTVKGRAREVFDAHADFHGGEVERECGKGLGRLKQAVATHAAMQAARRAGHIVSRRQLANGKVELTLAVK